MVKIFCPYMEDIEGPTSNFFNDEGRLLQAEYAVKNVSHGGTIIGIVCDGGVVLFGLNQTKSLTKEKIYKLNNKTFCAVSGLFGDANMLIQYGRRISIKIENEILESPKPYVLCKYIGQKKQLYTNITDTRPFGVSILYCGYDDKYVLYSTDPSGTVNQWKAFAIGLNENLINQNLKNEYDETLPFDKGVEFLLKILIKSRECSLDMIEKMEILCYNKDQQRFLTLDEIKQIFESIQSNIS